MRERLKQAIDAVCSKYGSRSISPDAILDNDLWMLKGDMEIVADMGIKEKYWQNIYKNAYPQKSFTDPDFCVLEFTPSSGRFYADFTLADFEI